MPDRDDPTPPEPNRDDGDGLLVRVRSAAQPVAERAHTTVGHPAPNRPPVVGDPDRPPRVLGVDANPDAADALAAVAELLGCEARACHGGAEALDALRGELPDALLLDLSMPEVDGLAVAACARELAGRRPLLLVATTALGSLEDRTAT